MTALPSHLYTAEQSRELDRRAIAAGTPGYTLMCRAAAAAFRLLCRRWPEARQLVVLAGPGNNGGDGYVLASLARAAGKTVQLLTVGDHTALRGEAAQAQADAQAAGVNIQAWSGSLPVADVYIDALLGTGLNKPPQGDFAAAIAELNARGRPVLALDLPSGLAADTGAELGQAVAASATISFIALKLGLLTGRGSALCGELFFDELGVPSAIYKDLPPAAHRLQQNELKTWLPRRPRDAHKGSHGHLLLIGGNQGMAGAIALAAEAAARTGAGMLSVATRPEHTALITGRRPELMVQGIGEAADLAPLLARASVLVLGPGLGQDAWAQALFEAALAAGKPLLVDADGLNLLARAPRQNAPWVLTPHPGEAARLLGCDVATVQADRPAAVRELAARFAGTVVLKGAGSLVASGPDLSLCAYGNPGMGVGGMGDVLAGIIGALLAQGLSSYDAARAGVMVHALAGDAAARSLGERGLMASDLFPFIQQGVNPCQSWT